MFSSLSVADPVQFRNRKGRTFKAQPVTIELGKFVRGDKSTRTANNADWRKQVCGLLENDEQASDPSDLLHAVAALYDTCLSDVPLPAIYRTLCAEGSRTVLLLRSTAEILEEWEAARTVCRSNRARENSFGEINNNPPSVTPPLGRQGQETEAIGREDANHVQSGKFDSETEDDTSSSHTYQRENWKLVRRDEEQESLRICPSLPSVGEHKSDVESHGDAPFSDVFSDSEDVSDSLSEMEEEDDQEDFARGMESFVRSAINRRRERRLATDSRHSHVGVEHRLMACATFQKNYRIPGTKVVHVSLISVRKRFRKSSIGRFLIKRLKSPQLVGPYDALVLFADNRSSAFFQKNGFTDDVILNSRFSDIDDGLRDNCKSFCYLPPFDGNYPPLLGVQEWSSTDAMSAMDDEIDKWKQKSLESYQAQVTCMTRLHQEILRLHGLLKKQEATILCLKKENQRLHVRISKAEKRSTRALLDALEKEATEFEKLCSFRVRTQEQS